MSTSSYYAMFTPAANAAVAHLLDAFGEYSRQAPHETYLLHWWRVRRALLGLEYPEVYDTAVREELWACLSTLGLSEAFICKALAYAPPAEVLFGLPSADTHRTGETNQEREERLRAAQEGLTFPNVS